jgi:hypothetical protein
MPSITCSNFTQALKNVLPPRPPHYLTKLLDLLYSPKQPTVATIANGPVFIFIDQYFIYYVNTNLSNLPTVI